MGVKGVIFDTSNFNDVIKQINAFYEGVTGKCPEQFAFHEIKPEVNVVL
jgi:hypothetical protein